MAFTEFIPDKSIKTDDKAFKADVPVVN
jgi:hypothetical protein